MESTEVLTVVMNVEIKLTYLLFNVYLSVSFYKLPDPRVPTQSLIFINRATRR